MQEIPWFGKRDLKREIAELEAEGAKGRALGTWNEVAARIKTSYAQLYYLDRNERLTREILDLMVRLEKVAQVRYAGGLAAQQDVIRAQVEQTAMQNELIALETEHHHLMSRLNALLGRPAHASLAKPESLRPLPPADKLDHVTLEGQVRARNPLLSADEHRVKAAEKGRELVYKNRYPDLTLGVVPNQVQNEVKQWDLMFEVNIPLQQTSRRAQEREAEAMLSASRARRDATANQLLADLSENVSALEAARRSERLTTDSLLPQAELTFKAALAGYETGKVDFATLLDAQRQIRQARLTQIKSLAEAQIRLAEIERILGEDL
jgi:outer membrane protein TolC